MVPYGYMIDTDTSIKRLVLYECHHKLSNENIAIHIKWSTNADTYCDVFFLLFLNYFTMVLEAKYSFCCCDYLNVIRGAGCRWAATFVFHFTRIGEGIFEISHVSVAKIYFTWHLFWFLHWFHFSGSCHMKAFHHDCRTFSVLNRRTLISISIRAIKKKQLSHHSKKHGRHENERRFDTSFSAPWQERKLWGRVRLKVCVKE